MLRAAQIVSLVLEGKEPPANTITVLDRPMMYRMVDGDLVQIFKTGVIDGIGVGLTAKGQPYNGEWIDISKAHLVWVM